MGTKKINWLKCPKTYHNLYKTRLNDKHLIERLRSDYESELQSYKANKWIKKKEITFKPSILYLQKQNSISKLTKRMIINMIRAIIVEGNIGNNL